MKLRQDYRKPTVSLESPLCDFRSSKAYFWGLVRDRLAHNQSTSSNHLHILDAACHALITRSMFPANCRYYGLDISKTRLEKALSLKHPSDILFHADLCKSLPFSHCFDVVVSCNTLSHLPFDQQLAALLTLISCCKHGADFLVNITIDANLSSIALALLRAFDSVEIVYFDSFRSLSDESSSLINRNNVILKMQENESSIINSACLHTQAFFHARSYAGSNLSNKLPLYPYDVISRLNSVPSVSLYNLDDDLSLLNFLSNQKFDQILLTSRFFSSPCGSKFCNQLDGFAASYSELCMFTVDLNHPSNLILLGLESDWCDVAFERIYVNRLRELPDVLLNFGLVSTRIGHRCKPSLIVTDY